jgi:hypothetical protein
MNIWWHVRRIVVTLCLLGAVVGTSGCAVFLIGAVAVGAGTIAYVQGELKSSEEATMDQAYNASLATLKELQLKVAHSEKDAISASILAHRSNNTPIRINLKRLTDRATEIRIRVGTFGDEGLSRTIRDKIVARL